MWVTFTSACVAGASFMLLDEQTGKRSIALYTGARAVESAFGLACLMNPAVAAVSVVALVTRLPHGGGLVLCLLCYTIVENALAGDAAAVLFPVCACVCVCVYVCLLSTVCVMRTAKLVDDAP